MFSKTAFIAMTAILVSANLAMAGEKSMQCQSPDGIIRIEVASELPERQDFAVDQNVVKLASPFAFTGASIKFNREMSRRIDFDITGSNDTESFSLQVRGRRYRFKSWETATRKRVENFSDGIDCRVIDSDAIPMK